MLTMHPEREENGWTALRRYEYLLIYVAVVGTLTLIVALLERAS